MDWKKAWILIGVLLFSGCSVILGDHPFSYGPKSSGKLDKTPEILILRGEDYAVCGVAGKVTELHYFVYFKWMTPPSEVMVWAGARDGNAPRTWLRGAPEMSFTLKATVDPGMAAYHQFNLLANGQIYSTITVLADCRFVSVAR